MPDGRRRVRVLVADDHPVYLDGLTAAIGRAEDLELVASCEDGEDALATIRSLAPDVAVLDLKMPNLSALDVLDALDGESVATRVLVLTAFPDGDAVHRALSTGAAGYIIKEEPRARICEAIRSVAAGRAVIGQAAQTEMAHELRNRHDVPTLTGREREILGMLGDGLTAREIAERLVLGTATVKTHLHHLYEKLGVTDRAAAVAVAMRRGLLR
jgi:two-component system, NarL family, nitrate/nitrite response regulator NarL